MTGRYIMNDRYGLHGGIHCPDCLHRCATMLPWKKKVKHEMASMQQQAYLDAVLSFVVITTQILPAIKTRIPSPPWGRGLGWA